MAKWYYPPQDNKQGAQLEELFTKTHTSSEAISDNRNPNMVSHFLKFSM
jgi:hypothetical protein